MKSVLRWRSACSAWARCSAAPADLRRAEPAGATDIIARAAAVELSKTLGQPVTVDNRPVAGGNLGSEMAARSAPDGYTMVMSASSLHGITPFLYTKLNYDPNKDLAPVIVLAGFANVLVMHPGVKANSVKELTALAKSQPGGLTCASSGSGSTIHMSCEMYKHMLGLQITHVPYKGSGPAMIDLLGGQVNPMFDNIPSAITRLVQPRHARGHAEGDHRAHERRGPEGHQGARLHMKRMADLGYEIIGGTPEQMGAMIQDELKRWGPIVKASGAKVD